MVQLRLSLSSESRRRPLMRVRRPPSLRSIPPRGASSNRCLTASKPTASRRVVFKKAPCLETASDPTSGSSGDGPHRPPLPPGGPPRFAGYPLPPAGYPPGDVPLGRRRGRWRMGPAWRVTQTCRSSGRRPQCRSRGCRAGGTARCWATHPPPRWRRRLQTACGSAGRTSHRGDRP